MDAELTRLRAERAEIKPMIGHLIEWASTSVSPTVYRGKHVLEIALLELMRLQREVDQRRDDGEYLAILEELADRNQLARAQAMLAEKTAKRDALETNQ